MDFAHHLLMGMALWMFLPWEEGRMIPGFVLNVSSMCGIIVRITNSLP
jgi:hypothetical protein